MKKVTFIVEKQDSADGEARFSIRAALGDTGRGGKLVDNLTRAQALAMLNAYQAGALLVGGAVSARSDVLTVTG